MHQSTLRLRVLAVNTGSVLPRRRQVRKGFLCSWCSVCHGGLQGPALELRQVHHVWRMESRGMNDPVENAFRVLGRVLLGREDAPRQGKGNLRTFLQDLR